MLNPSTVRKIGLTFAAITQMAITVVLGIFLGGWLDSLHSIGPLFLFTLSLGALVFGIQLRHGSVVCSFHGQNAAGVRSP